jgi:hypothetical protein
MPTPATFTVPSSSSVVWNLSAGAYPTLKGCTDAGVLDRWCRRFPGRARPTGRNRGVLPLTTQSIGISALASPVLFFGHRDRS